NSSTSPNNTVTVNNATATSGSCLWSGHFGGTMVNVDSASVAGVAQDKSGNLIGVGWFKGTVNFGGGPVASVGSQDIFIVKFDSSGNYQWLKRFGSAGSSDQASGVALDSSNNIVVVGTFTGSVDFGSGPLASMGSSDVFLIKFSPTGTLQFAKRF